MARRSAAMPVKRTAHEKTRRSAVFAQKIHLVFIVRAVNCLREKARCGIMACSGGILLRPLAVMREVISIIYRTRGALCRDSVAAVKRAAYGTAQRRRRL